MFEASDSAWKTHQRITTDRVWLSTYRAWVIVAILVIIGALLRLWDLSLIEFRHDSAWWAIDGLRILRGGYLPLIGQQVGSVSIPFYNGPFFAYLTAAVFAFAGYEPVAVSALIAISNSVAIILAYLLGRRLYSPMVGLIAATMMTVAPWMVLYGRMFWPQALFPFLIPLALLTLVRAIERQHGVWYLFFGLLVGIGVQLHLSVLAIVGTGALFILLYARPRWLVLMYSLGVALGYAPVILYDLFHSFANLQGILSLPQVHATADPRHIHMAKTIWNFSNVLSGQGLWVSKVSKTPFLHPAIEWGQGLILSGLLLFSGIIMILHIWHTNGSARWWRLKYQDALVFMFILFPLLYLFFSRSVIQRHYFIFFAPLTMILIARGLEIWKDQNHFTVPQFIRRTPMILLGVGLILNCVTALMLLSFIQQSGGEGEYGTVLADKKAAITTIVSTAGDDFILDLQGAREPLPFIFLVEAQVGGQVSGDLEVATEIQANGTSGQPRMFRVVELPYETLDIKPGETIVFHQRGVVVLEQHP